MTKRQLIDEIVAMNQTAKPAFLARFPDSDLNDYLRHLRVAGSPRLSGDSSRYEKYFRNAAPAQPAVAEASPTSAAVATLEPAPLGSYEPQLAPTEMNSADDPAAVAMDAPAADADCRAETVNELPAPDAQFVAENGSPVAEESLEPAGEADPSWDDVPAADAEPADEADQTDESESQDAVAAVDAIAAGAGDDDDDEPIAATPHVLALAYTADSTAAQPTPQHRAEPTVSQPRWKQQPAQAAAQDDSWLF